MMKWIVIVLAAGCFVLIAQTAPCHDACSRHTAGGCTHTHNAMTNVTCDALPQTCTAPCGETGDCKEVTGTSGVVAWRDCRCIQRNTASANYATTAGWHMVDVTPPDIVPGGINVFTFRDTSQMDAMKFIYGNGAIIDSLAGGVTGSMVIQWEPAGTPLVGQLQEFWMSFPSYDYFGNPTGVNFWELNYAEPQYVIYQETHGYLTIEPEEPIDLFVWNDFIPYRPGWMDMATFVPFGRDGVASVWITEADEVPAGSAVESKSWGSIKKVYH